MVWVEALVPFDKGELLSTMHQVGMVERTVSILSILINFIFLLFYQELILHHYFLMPFSLPLPLCIGIYGEWDIGQGTRPPSICKAAHSYETAL